MSHTPLLSKITTPIDRYLRGIDRGGFFRRPIAWLFFATGGAALLATFAFLAEVYDQVDNVGSLFKGENSGYALRLIVFAIALACILLAAGVFCMLIWWRRAKHINRDLLPGEEYTATPLVALLVQTTAETIGAWVGIVGAAGTLLIFLLSWGHDAHGLMRIPGLEEFSEIRRAGVIGVLLFPIIGWLIVLLGKWMAELLKVMASIANNTRSLRPKPSEEAIVIELGDDDEVIAVDEV
ncbi:MAG: hypothetical protein IT228_07960 [Flavobacteriales bacterium]|nr:hypothetical protein [Flavobacteriales bacterium]